MELSFCCLRCKEVVNICDGKRLGNISDITFDSCFGKITGIIVPCEKSFWSIFKNNNELFIPYHHICKIGKDVILVQLNTNNSNCCSEGINILNNEQISNLETNSTDYSQFINQQKNKS